jgi:hypothetical protein
MAEIYLTITQLTALFQKVTLDILDIDYGEEVTVPPLTAEEIAAEQQAAGARVRVSWQKEGQPAFAITDNVCFLRVTEADGQINRQREPIQAEKDADYCTMNMQYTRLVRVDWLFYGPTSYDDAQDVRDKMLYQAHHDKLALLNVFLVPDVQAPRRTPEQFQGQWWERTDLTMYFNEHVKREEDIAYIKSAVITLKMDTGAADRVIEIEETTEVHDIT